MDDSVREALYTLQEFDINIILLIILVYLSIGWFAVEGTYEVIKNLMDRFTKIKVTTDDKIKFYEEQREKNVERALATNDEGLKRTYEDLAYENLRDIERVARKKKESSWLHIVIPSILGLFYAFWIYPFTIFTLLPFRPPYMWMEYIIMGILFYRGSNLAHGGGNKVGGLFESLIGRISSGRFF